MTPLLRMAVLSGVKASVQLHLRLGGAVDVTDTKGRTPLILAASRGHTEICRLLLDAGADLAHVDVEGNDALRVATTKGHLAVAEMIRAAASGTGSAPNPRQAMALVSPDVEMEERCSPDEEPPSQILMPILAASASATCEAALGRADIISGTTALVAEDVRETAVEFDSEIQQTEEGRVATDPSPGMSELAGPAAFDQFDLDDRGRPDPQNSEDFDLSGWDEEVDSPPPPADPACAGLAGDLQRQLSLHVPIDRDADWDDVDIELPEALASVRRRAKLDDDGEAALRELFLVAVAGRWIEGELLATVAPRDPSDSELPDPDFVANLRVTLGDLGVIVDDDPSSTDWIRAFDLEDDSEEIHRDEVAQALDFLRILNSNNSDPLTHFVRDLPYRRLTRDEEVSLAGEIEAGTKTALSAIAMSPAAASELLSAVEAVLTGVTPPSDILDSDEEERDAGLDDDAARGIDDLETQERLPLQSDLLFRLREVHALCISLSEERDGGGASRLGERLTALGLSHAFVSRLRHAVETDPAGSDARCLMAAGLEQARRAKERFAVANLELVMWSAKKFGGLTWSDRVQEGNFGLLKAVERFDHRRGAKFATYAVWWIRQSITRAVTDIGRTIRIPVHVHESIRKLRRAQDQVYALTGRDASPEQLASLTEIPLARVRKLLTVADEPASIEIDDVWCEAAEVASTEPDPEATLAAAEIKALVKRQLEILTPRQAAVIRMRFGIECEKEHTLEEVGQQFGVTRERIRQIEAKALQRLSHPRWIKIFRECV